MEMGFSAQQFGDTALSPRSLGARGWSGRRVKALQLAHDNPWHCTLRNCRIADEIPIFFPMGVRTAGAQRPVLG